MTRRQRPGAACEECRRRKLKCNGAEPQCSVCADSGIECVIVRERAARGPKKGYLKVLKDRIAVLEGQLRESQLPTQALCHNLNSAPTSNVALDKTTPVTYDTAVETPDIGAPQLDPMRVLLPSVYQGDLIIDPDIINLPSALRKDFLSMDTCPAVSNTVMPESALGFSSISPPLSDIMKAELNQIFFDRVHPFVPILQQRHYLRNVKQTDARTDSQVCLQYSMWSLACFMSAHLQHLQESFYLEAKHMLGNLDLLPNVIDDQTETEIAQSWVLIAVFESMKANHRQAWLSAGRALRLVQLMRLHELDALAVKEDNVTTQSQFVKKEERRRVLWMAYLIDHLFCMRNNWPITLSERAIHTRLPAPEKDFQNGKQSVGDFLSNAIDETYSTKTSAFSECLVLVSLCERNLLYCQPNDTNRLRAHAMVGESDQYPSLDKVLDCRLQMLSESYTSPSEVCDPMILFAHMMSQAAILYISRNIKSKAAQSIDVSSNCIGAETQQRALLAADNIIALAKSLIDFHLFKTHPLTPIPLFISIEFLYANRYTTDDFNTKLQDLRGVFGELKSINNPSQSYIDLLGLSCTPTAIEMMAD